MTTARIATAAVIAALLVGAATYGLAQRAQPQATFPHERHASLFTSCATCHGDVQRSGAPVFPAAARCAGCHDGEVRPRVQWQARTKVNINSLRFTHARHDTAMTAKRPADSLAMNNCASCHVRTGDNRLAVRYAVVNQCLSCHGLQGSHFDVDRNACATCHVPLTQAPRLTRDVIAKFPKPASHDAPGFVLGGHGAIAKVTRGGTSPVAANCATCHARNLCLACHVDAPDVPAIQALALDERPPAFTRDQPVPVSHATNTFLRAHGAEARKATARCATCHARSSCLTCHIGNAPATISRLPAAAAGRAAGAHVERTPPPSHTERFRTAHGREADARPRSCETCHERTTCLTCHRPDGARSSAYHPTGFLTSHPNQAYSRTVSCARCHNTQQFCQSCHQQSGLTATARLARRGYHDAFRGFSLGHGQAARQHLESCASCHAERDCTSCHSAVGGGYGFNPHGANFNAARARAKNPSVCIACHGRAIPTR
ncbi:cytochrome c3 family protein [Gemmatimonas aurantiaca]|uniref:cytochrome c3 family protein n=1 Tax=Gemmatimonas aurantiaca TaxID=173480 RepID=UPI00301BC5EB